ncbi:MAG TPA: 4Fe-4S binding protein, partial [Clostridia bacterium]|nr:4Fe-4S binding protein [Clostridia bacterium]
MDNIEKLDRQLCTGCGLCHNVCPYNAIEMRTNKEGFLYPYVNLNCINCGLCYNACPQIKPSNNFNKVLESYAVLCKDEIRSQCSSGGFFGAAAYYAISQGGAVIGAGYDNNFR